MICKSCENPILKSEKYFRPPHGGYRHEDCMPAKMRRRIEVLEEENFRLIAEVDRDTGLCAAAADRISRLEADLVIARTTEANLHDHIRKLQEDFGKANAKWLKAEMALRKIADMCGDLTLVWSASTIKRIAEIARKTLKGK